MNHKRPFCADTAELRAALDRLYARYNRRALVAPDPLQFLYNYEDPLDREVVALIAAVLAYGRVAQIVKSVGRVLDRLGPAPATLLRQSTASDIEKRVTGIRHRFTTERDIAGLLFALRYAIRGHASLCRCFSSFLQPHDATVLPALDRFVRHLAAVAPALSVFTLPRPAGGSACKRLHLFLRWMVRRDAVDPGGWEGIDPAMLVVPIDTHMFRIGQALGFTQRRQADGASALDITRGFRQLAPQDPVRYDFALTRLGMRGDVAAQVLPGGYPNFFMKSSTCSRRS